jgi:hypothetical protein
MDGRFVTFSTILPGFPDTARQSITAAFEAATTRVLDETSGLQQCAPYDRTEARDSARCITARQKSSSRSTRKRMNATHRSISFHTP